MCRRGGEGEEERKKIRVTGVALIANVGVNIAFLGAVRILATSLRHRTQND